MGSSNCELIRDHYERMGQGHDLAQAADLLDPEIEWIEPALPGLAPLVVRGREAVVRDVWGTFGDGFEELRIKIDELLDAGDAIVALGAFRGRTSEGRPLDVSFVHIWKLRDSKAVYMRTYADTAAYMVARGLIEPIAVPQDPG